MSSSPLDFGINFPLSPSFPLHSDAFCKSDNKNKLTTCAFAMWNRNLLPLPQYIFILFFIRARGPGIRRSRRVCVLARARAYAKGRYFSLRNAPGRFQVVWSRRKSVSSFFFANCPHPFPCLSFLCFGKVLSTFLFFNLS